MDANRFSIEHLPNGLYRVFDYACQWAIVYAWVPGHCNNVRWQHGGIDSMAARIAVVKFREQNSAQVQ